MRIYICHIIAAAIATIGLAVPARGQVAGPVTPALTPAQIASSKATAKKHDEADAKEQRRLQKALRAIGRTAPAKLPRRVFPAPRSARSKSGRS